MEVTDGRLTIKRNTLKVSELYPEDIFTLFAEATECAEILYWFKKLLFALKIQQNDDHTRFYQRLKENLNSWRCQSLWDLLDVRAKHKEYEQGKVCSHVRVLVIGCGPIGLRTAIEAALLGCHTVIVERRNVFTRNNVLHLWPFLMADFRALGAKKFYGKFGAGAIDHISIRTLQSILLKVCLILGVQVFTGVEFKKIVEPENGSSWKGSYHPESHCLNQYEFDVIIGADGKKNVLPGFEQIEMRGALAIGITCNFVNNNSQEEAHVKEICGIAYQFHQEFFDKLEEIHRIKLENIVYYKDETHYFVMTVSKGSLLTNGALKKDYAEPKQLLDRSNVDKEKLLQTTLTAVKYATNNELTSLELAKNPDGSPDIACFDFTSIKKAANVSRIIERRGRKLLLALVGDSALEPFWPTGSGCGRGVLSALDAAWMIRGFGLDTPPMYLIRERENIFKLLSGVTNSDLQKTYGSFTINPKTRYLNLNTKSVMNMNALKKLYDTDDHEADFTVGSPVQKGMEFNKVFVKPTRQRRKSGGKRFLLKKNKRRSDRTELREAKHVSKTKQMWQEKSSEEEEQLPVKKRKPSIDGSSGSSSMENILESSTPQPPVEKQRSFSVSSSADERTSPTARPANQRTFSFGDSIDEVTNGNGTTHADDNTPGDFSFHLQSEQQKRKPRRSITYMTFLDEEELSKEEDKLQNNLQMNMGEKLDKILKKRESMNEKNKEKVAARKSVAKAKRRLNKMGRSQSSESDQDKENTKRPAAATKDQNGERKRYNRETFQRAFSITSGKRKADEQQKSTKDLIAEAEARFTELPKDPIPRSNSANSQKRKAVPDSNGKYQALNDADISKEPQNVMVGKDVSGVTVRRKHKSAKHDAPLFDPGVPSREETDLYRHNAAVVHTLMPQRHLDAPDKKASSSAVEYTAGLAALALIACPLLMKCNRRPVGVDRTGSGLRKVSVQKTVPAPDQRETQELSLKRAGSVRKAIEQYKNIIEKGDTETETFQSFKQKKKNTLCPDEADGSEFDEINDMDSSYGPKDIVDLERAFLSEELLPKNRNTLGKQAPPLGILLRLSVLELLNENTFTVALTALQLMVHMHREILRHLNEDKYYRVSLHNQIIEKHLWNVVAGRKFLKYLGWTQCGRFLLLSKGTSVQESCMILEEGIRLCEKGQYSGTRSKSRSSVAVGKSPSFRDQFAIPVSPLLRRRQEAAAKGSLKPSVSSPSIPQLEILPDISSHSPIASPTEIPSDTIDGHQLAPPRAIASSTPGLGDSYCNISMMIDNLEESAVDDRLVTYAPPQTEDSYLVVDLKKDAV